MRKLSQKGQGMTEYILIVALIAVAVIGAMKFFGSKAKEGFHTAGDDLSKAVQSGDKSSSDQNGTQIR